MQLFTEFIGEYEGRIVNQVEREVGTLSESIIKDEAQAETYVAEIITRYKLGRLTLNFEKAHKLGHREERVEEYDAFEGSVSSTRALFNFAIPFEGDVNLLKLRPDHSKRISQEFDILHSAISFELPYDKNNGDANKAAYQRVVDVLAFNVNQLNRFVEGINQNIASRARKTLEQRRETLKGYDDGLASFGLPAPDQ